MGKRKTRPTPIVISRAPMVAPAIVHQGPMVAHGSQENQSCEPPVTASTPFEDVDISVPPSGKWEIPITIMGRAEAFDKNTWERSSNNIMVHPSEESLRRSSSPNEHSDWLPEEDAKIIEVVSSIWENLSEQLPGRSAVSCRLHYQNKLARLYERDEDQKNKLAVLYQRENTLASSRSHALADGRARDGPSQLYDGQLVVKQRAYTI